MQIRLITVSESNLFLRIMMQGQTQPIPDPQTSGELLDPARVSARLLKLQRPSIPHPSSGPKALPDIPPPLQSLQRLPDPEIPKRKNSDSPEEVAAKREERKRLSTLAGVPRSRLWCLSKNAALLTTISNSQKLELNLESRLKATRKRITAGEVGAADTAASIRKQRSEVSKQLILLKQQALGPVEEELEKLRRKYNENDN